MVCSRKSLHYSAAHSLLLYCCCSIFPSHTLGALKYIVTVFRWASKDLNIIWYIFPHILNIAIECCSLLSTDLCCYASFSFGWLLFPFLCLRAHWWSAVVCMKMHLFELNFSNLFIGHRISNDILFFPCFKIYTLLSVCLQYFHLDVLSIAHYFLFFVLKSISLFLGWTIIKWVGVDFFTFLLPGTWGSSIYTFAVFIKFKIFTLGFFSSDIFCPLFCLILQGSVITLTS